MKKYKHKKTGIIVEGDKVYIQVNSFETVIPKEIVENSNDWQEITKPEYTILSFYRKSDNMTFNMTIGESYGIKYKRKDTVFLYSLEEFTTKSKGNWTEEFEIYQVRRESDGEVFTVGDTIKCLGRVKEVVIESFKIESNNGLRTFHTNNKYGLWLHGLEKVKPKEWEITAFIAKPTKSIFNLNKNSNTFGNNCLNQEKILNDKNFEIYSIKRLSDSVEFKIGDIIQYKDGQTAPSLINSKVKIEEISKHSNIEDLFRFKQVNGGWRNLTKDYSIVKSLFTTEDLKEVFEGDNLYYVKFKEKRNTVGKPFEVISCSFPGCIYEPEHEKYFSSKENAEKFIMYHKPCLTLNEVLSIYKKTYETSQVLKDFVKQKLKQ